MIGYTKEIVERRHAAQHSMALGVIEEKRLKFTKTYFTNRKISAIVYLGYSKYVMIADRKVFILRKNHILLARYLKTRCLLMRTYSHIEKAFCLGNILPDIQPSFVTKRHEYFGTFDEGRKDLPFG